MEEAKEIEQRMESQNTHTHTHTHTHTRIKQGHVTLRTELHPIAFTLNYLAASTDRGEKIKNNFVG